jgi:hypothetical protein
MVYVGDAVGLDKSADLLQGADSHHDSGGNNEVDVDQSWEDAPNWIVPGDASVRRVPVASVHVAHLVHQSRRAVSKHHSWVIE